MKKPIKYLWLALSGVVALVVAGIVVFALTFDPNRYKGDIERIAKERTGRTLRLQGELKLAFFPSLGAGDRKSTRLNSSHTVISYAVFCLKKKKKQKDKNIYLHSQQL